MSIKLVLLPCSCHFIDKTPLSDSIYQKREVDEIGRVANETHRLDVHEDEEEVDATWGSELFPKEFEGFFSRTGVMSGGERERLRKKEDRSTRSSKSITLFILVHYFNVNSYH